MWYIVFSALFSLTSAAVFYAELTKVESFRERLVRAGEWENYLREKEAHLQKFDKSESQSTLYDYEDSEYVINITIGTPPQFFVVLPDIGSNIFWVVDKNCPNCEYPPPNGDRFDPSQSSTCNETGKTYHIAYGDGSAGSSGDVAEDVLTIGDDQNFTVQNTAFGLASYFHNFVGASEIFHPFDGIFGLSPEQDANVSSPIFTMIEQNLLDQSIFTFYLQRRGHAEGVPAGRLTFGGIDEENCGPVIGYANFTLPSWYYSILVDQVAYKDIVIKLETDNLARIDSGNAWIFVPNEIFNKYIVDVNATTDGSYYYADCNATTDPVIFIIGGHEYEVESQQLITDPENDTCRLYIGSGLGLGDPFMRSYCHVFDIGNERIDFAKPKA
uniref:Peptidase A1 domain-containing protein n=1 Tax=Acrobeloides nanus TaxID=290746 RepID=A0A914C3P3_9BILA